MPEKITLADMAAAAKTLGCDLAAVRAVVEVESGPLGGFDATTGLPIILFEPHVFSRRTDRRYDESHPAISYRKWRTRPYPKTQEERWQQLSTAQRLDYAAAVESASWGLFQIMGFNHAACGFRTAGDFSQAMHESEAKQLAAFVAFLQANGLDGPLRRHDWHAFARGYNGSGYAQHGYHTKLEAAWSRHGGKET